MKHDCIKSFKSKPQFEPGLVNGMDFDKAQVGRRSILVAKPPSNGDVCKDCKQSLLQ